MQSLVYGTGHRTLKLHGIFICTAESNKQDSSSFIMQKSPPTIKMTPDKVSFRRFLRGDC